MLNQLLNNRYHLEAELGQGGMGTVYRAHDVLLGRQVAVKVLNTAGLGATGKARLIAEARAVARLNHPNIVTVHDAGVADGAPFIVMEVVPGMTLRECAPPSLESTLELIRQVCVALEHAHAADVIHRDLKLENVIVSPTGTAKLMDFGLARTTDGPRLTENGALVGTFLYMAPELLGGDDASISSDLYALGVMFYELACGQPPFKGADPLVLMSQHLQATPMPPSTHNPAIPPEIETLILRLLAKRPADRPASAAIVRAWLEPSTQPDIAVPSVGAALDRIVRGRLVGREHELAEAIQLWRRAQTGDAGLLLISGEPGVGKSRLVRELTIQVQMARGTPLLGECFAEGNAPYAPFAQMILTAGDGLADLPPLVLADLLSLAPALRVRYPDVLPNPSLAPQAEQQRLYESAYTFCARLAAVTPLLLLFEDVHWADGGTLSLLRSLTRRFQQTRTPILVALTFREAELADQKGLANLLTSWSRERAAQALKLHRLDAAGTHAMLEAVFAESVTASLSDSIYRETEGNPFFIEEICKALIESGRLKRENGRWQRHSKSPMELPRSIRLAIESRLAGLPPASQEVLHLAAVLGRRFEFEVLQAAYTESASSSGAEEDVLIAALEEAERAQLLNEVGRGGVFEFAHALIPTTLTEGLGGMRRRRLHRRATAALEKLHPADYKTLAHHCLHAGEDERALGFLLKAAEYARRAFANAAAVADYQQALGLLTELAREPARAEHWRATMLQLYGDLGDVLELTGQHEAAGSAYASALTLIPPGNAVLQSCLLRKTGKALETQRLYDEAATAYHDAEAALGEEPPEATPAWRHEWVMIQLDRIYLDYWRGRVNEMTQLVEKVRPAIERVGTPLQRSKFFCSLVTIAYRRDRYVIDEETLALGAEAVAAARQTDSLEQLGWAQFLSGFSHLWHEDLDEADEQLRAALQTSERSGDVTTQTRCLTYLTVVYRKRGEIEQVLRFAARSHETAAVGQMIEYIGMAQANLAWAARRQGKFAEATELGVAAWETMQKTMQAQVLAWVAVWPLLGLALAARETSNAVEYARQLTNPTTQPQPEVLAVPLLAAIQAWEQEKPVEAYACLTQAAVLAEPIGYL